MWGVPDAMNVRNGKGSPEIPLVVPLIPSIDIACKPTTRSRDRSGAKGKLIPLGCESCRIKTTEGETACRITI
jgi:hypothetical protein